jgi:hypothetical protein
MSAQNKKDSDFTYKVIKVIRSERQNEKNRIDLRVIQWGRAGSPVLEKRRIWEKDGEDMNAKLVGLTRDDLKHLYEKHAEILNLM